MTDPAAGAVSLGAFPHRRDYGEVRGRDRWTVRAVNAWVRETLPPLVAASDRAGAVLDVGCGEQPFRPLVESNGRRYVGMDVEQNGAGTVDMLSTLEDAPHPAQGYALILCTEVLEHVADIDAAFAGLRRLIAAGGAVVVTVPFMFPLHMEPYDFRRLTVHGIERLAADHGFRVDASARLGRLPDVLAMLVADASILPASRSVFAKAKVVILRAAAAAAVRLLDSRALSNGVAINSNAYLSNGVVLRAV
ncbi:MAG TPA: methyltransferase domain-containing protein [Vicinamibacterales bacterium]|nr:methyltransferase domain-containing protein [Vicinamibacterales bacterium]